MPGVYDRLQKKLELEKREEGISPIEIAGLPPNLRKLMRLLVRESLIFYKDLLVKVGEMPERDRLTKSELDEALQELTRQGWLISRGEGERINYQVNLRRRAGSKIAQGIWAKLDEKIAESKKTPGNE
jgi:DNA-binding transcriptional ArsR family regulator